MICNTIGSSNREMIICTCWTEHGGRHYHRIPYLHVDEYLKRKGKDVSWIRNSDRRSPWWVGSYFGGKLAAEIMLKNKCRKVLHITGVAPNVAANNPPRRFEAELSSHGVDVVDMMMEGTCLTISPYWDAAAEAIRKCDGIDGVFAADQPALCYMHLAMEAGRRVPEDLKVVTYDGMDITRLCYPRVTSICQDVRFLAETCSKTMIKLIEGKEPVPQNQILSVKIQQGGTTYPVDLDGK